MSWIFILIIIISLVFYRNIHKHYILLQETITASNLSIHNEFSSIIRQIQDFKQKDQVTDLLTPYLLTKTKDNLWMAVIHNDFISTRILQTGMWEPATTHFFTKNIKAGERIIELGVNIGYYATLFGKLTGRTGQVIGYEANKIVYDLAQLSVRMNELSDTVTLYNAAVSNKSGYVNFTYDMPINEGPSINAGTAHIVSEGMRNKDNYIQVKAVTLDEDLPDISDVDWLLLDIEGSELMALQGAKHIIQRSPTIKIIMEWNAGYLRSFSDIEQFIDDYLNDGFSFYYLSNKVSAEPLSKESLMKLGNTNRNFLITRAKLPQA